MPTPEPFPYRKLNYPIVNLEQSFTLAEKLQGLANLGVPSSVNKAGQVLTVGDATGELEWSTVSGGGDIPSSSSADEGKVLTVDSNGEPQWAPPSGGGGGGDVTDVKVNGTSVVTNHVAEVTVPTKTSDLTNDSGFITSADLPTVNDGTLTIQKNGATVDTFTANSSTNKTVNISVPTKTSDLTNDSGFITSSDIPAVPVSDVQVDGVSVVSSGVANITLPTVNDGTLTIQKNGSTIDTFTANSSSNKTVDITVPTKTSDLQNDSGFVTAGDIRQLPASTSADSGKVLTVDSQGNPGWATGGSGGGGVPTPVGAFHCYLRSNDDDTGYTWAHLWEPLEREASLSIIDGELAYIFTDPIKLRTYKWMCPWYASSRQFMCNLRCDLGVDLAETHKTVYVQPALALYAAHYNTMPPGWVYTHSRIQDAAMSRVPVVQSTISGATHQLLDVSLSMPMAFPDSYWDDGWYNYFEGFRFKIYDEDGDPITLSAVNYSTVTNLYAMAP